MRLREGAGLFHSGLALASLPPAAIVSALFGSVSGPPAAACSALVLMALVQALALLSLSLGWRRPLIAMGRISHAALRIIPPRKGDGLGPERMIVALNNAMVAGEAPLSPTPSRILLLLPHCLQNHECTIRLVHDPEACRRCGRCDMAALLSLAGGRGMSVAVATGGTLARKALGRVKPDLVVAVACARDLCSGILDAWPRRVWGQLNELPNGECFDTTVDVRDLSLALDLLTGSGSDGGETSGRTDTSRPD
ncbi:DUF116 domain-containing protein [Candidatus Fermentibacteria bacterium]|nr:DUF116 domain-containing protein [Candidatus Fermentibacteria bacterium]